VFCLPIGREKASVQGERTEMYINFQAWKSSLQWDMAAEKGLMLGS
jgi:hypothetical protein